MAVVTNPILPGFHPDPSIVRVGEMYYLATSTFEWWPGVRLHRSRDLANWELVGGALTRRSQLDLRGNPDSGGVWAPALSYADGRFWLVYSDVKHMNGPFKDLRNYLVTAERIEGPWSEPVRLNGSGFDASLFHDADGRKWLLNQLWDSRLDRHAFAGIVLQEYSVWERRLIGEPVNIFGGTALRVTEGPHLLRKDGYYYLIAAEGGTGWDHAVTVARAKTLRGPYEVCPRNPILTARGRPELALQKAGHASFVETSRGDWYLVHLCSRPVGPKRRCILGRETALQRLEWPKGGWPRLADGGNAPSETVDLPEVNAAQPYLREFADDFRAAALGPHWNTLREAPHPDWLSLEERPGFLRLRGRHSPCSRFEQSLVGFRILHPRCRVGARLEFEPRTFQTRAGLAAYYDTKNFYYAYVSCSATGGREVQVLAAVAGTFLTELPVPHALPATGGIELHAVLHDGALQFLVGMGDATTPVGPALDATTLSDDHVIESGGWGFTGTFFALCAQDAADSGVPADFAWFRYQSGD